MLLLFEHSGEEFLAEQGVIEGGRRGGAGERREADGRGRLRGGMEQGGDRQWAVGEAKATCNESELVHGAETGSKRAEL